MAITDWIVIGSFFLILVGIIIKVVKQKEENTQDYFLAGKNAGWFSIGSSIFASNIGSEHLVGLAGAGFLSGMAMAHWEIQAWIILILGWVFVPFYDRIKISTMPEFLERRFSAKSRSVLSVISLVSYVLTKVAVTIYAGGVVFKTVFGIEEIWGIDFFWVSAIGLVLVTGLYTVFGGMKAIIYTSVLQTPVLLIGSIIILVIGLVKVGGWVEVERIVGENIHLIRSSSDPEFPWTGVILGSAIIGFWYWCTDQFIVQRVLSGRNQQQARRGTILAGYFKLLPVLIFLVPGMIAFALNQKGLLQVSGSDSAFAAMVAQLLPTGVTGIVVCGLLAALMSSLASLFNSSAMLFTEDFYKKMKPLKSEKHYVKVGRIATTAVVILGFAWIPVMLQLGKVLYEYLQAVQGLLAPAILSVFLLGVFWKKTTAKAAYWGMISGFGLGLFRLILNIVYGAKVSLITACEKAIRNIPNLTDLSAKKFHTELQEIGTKITNIAGESGVQAKELIDKTKELLSSDITTQSKEGAIQLVSQAKAHLSQAFTEQAHFLFQIASINWLHFCVFLFFFCIATMVLVSLVTKAPEISQLRYTFYSATDAEKKKTRASWNYWDVVHTVIIIILIVAFYLYFW